MKLNEYKFIKNIGKGGYGNVFKVQYQNNFYVIKQIDISNYSKKDKLDAYNEVKLLKSLNHPNIVKFYNSFIEDDKLNIVMEYCELGDLYCYLKKNKKLIEEKEVIFLFKRITEGVNYLHNKKILHRDIKTKNIFLSNNYKSIKIGDLGVSKAISYDNQLVNTKVGTPYYLSPELVEEKPYGIKSDIWAWGCVFYEICMKKHPFESKNQASLFIKILRGSFGTIINYSNKLKELIEQCLKRNTEIRPLTIDIWKKLESFKIKKELSSNKNKPKKENIKIINKKLLNVLKKDEICKIKKPSIIKNQNIENNITNNYNYKNNDNFNIYKPKSDLELVKELPDFKFFKKNIKNKEKSIELDQQDKEDDIIFEDNMKEINDIKCNINPNNKLIEKKQEIVIKDKKDKIKNKENNSKENNIYPKKIIKKNLKPKIKNIKEEIKKQPNSKIHKINNDIIKIKEKILKLITKKNYEILKNNLNKLINNELEPNKDDLNEFTIIFEKLLSKNKNKNEILKLFYINLSQELDLKSWELQTIDN